MKVLIQSRRNLFSLPGGDTVQLTRTKEKLEELGVEVDISLDFEPDLEEYDIVHLSNLTRIQETFLQMNNAKKQGKPIVLSTIFWPMDEFEKKGQKGIRKIIGTLFSIDDEEKLKAAARYLIDPTSRNEATKSLWRVGYKEMQKQVVDSVDCFLPNSEMEMDELVKYFGIPKKNYMVVPNAIDKAIVESSLKSKESNRFEQYRDAVVCVGRIETRKNQLSLLQALDGTGYTVVIVGKPSQNQPKYFSEIKRLIDRNPSFCFIEHIEHEELYELFKVCKVSVLPSWLDTPGLVSLEAGAMGCNLVVSPIGSTKEYFGDYAEYCYPSDLQSIRNAVDRAFHKPRTSDLSQMILNNYTWEKAAQITLEAYERVLAEKR